LNSAVIIYIYIFMLFWNLRLFDVILWQLKFRFYFILLYIENQQRHHSRARVGRFYNYKNTFDTVNECVSYYMKAKLKKKMNIAIHLSLTIHSLLLLFCNNWMCLNSCLNLNKKTSQIKRRTHHIIMVESINIPIYIIISCFYKTESACIIIMHRYEYCSCSFVQFVLLVDAIYGIVMTKQ